MLATCRFVGYGTVHGSRASYQLPRFFSVKRGVRNPNENIRRCMRVHRVDMRVLFSIRLRATAYMCLVMPSLIVSKVDY